MDGVGVSWECCKGTCALVLMWHILEPAHQLNALWIGARTGLCWVLCPDTSWKVWPLMHLEVDLILLLEHHHFYLPRVSFPCKGIGSCCFSELRQEDSMTFSCLLICQCLYVWQNSEWDLPSFHTPPCREVDGEGKYGSHMPLTHGDRPQNQRNMNGLKDLS